MKKELLFDFDGTIAATYDYVFDIAEDLAKDFNLPEVTPEMINRGRDLPLTQALKSLGLRGFRFFLASRRFQKYLYERLDMLKPVDGIGEVLKELKKKYTLGVLSSNGYLIMKSFLHDYKLEYFDYVKGGAPLLGKKRKIKGIMRKRGLDKDDIIYVGDEIRDIEGARGAGIKMVSVTWGYNSVKSLKEMNPDFLINKPEELLKLEF